MCHSCGAVEIRSPNQPKISKAYLPKTYTDSLRDEQPTCGEVAGGRRLVYFTVDSYLMPRLSSVFPLQQYPDPIEAFTKSSYERLFDPS